MLLYEGEAIVLIPTQMRERVRPLLGQGPRVVGIGAASESKSMQNLPF